jgi:hypothetical protein
MFNQIYSRNALKNKHNKSIQKYMFMFYVSKLVPSLAGYFAFRNVQRHWCSQYRMLFVRTNKTYLRSLEL